MISLVIYVFAIIAQICWLACWGLVQASLMLSRFFNSHAHK